VGLLHVQPGSGQRVYMSLIVRTGNVAGVMGLALGFQPKPPHNPITLSPSSRILPQDDSPSQSQPRPEKT
jgi:hypothetical protein